MMRFVLVLLMAWPFLLSAAPLSDLGEFADGLDFDNPENIADDYVRLTLFTPDYATAAQIKKEVELLLGPDMCLIESAERVLIQAPRDSSARIEFIAALLQLDIPL